MNIEIDESKNIVRYIIIPSVNEASYNSYDGLSDGSIKFILKAKTGSKFSIKFKSYKYIKSFSTYSDAKNYIKNKIKNL